MVIDWTAVFTGIIAVLASVAAFWQVGILIWEKIVPNVDARIQNVPNSGRFAAGEETTLIFEFQNKAKKTFLFGIRRKLTLHDVSVQMFFPIAFDILEVKRHISVNPAIGNGLFEAPSTGRYSGRPYFYVFVPDPFNRIPPRMSSLADEETEWCFVTARLPDEPGTYKIILDISYQEGEQQQAEIDIQVVRYLPFSDSNRTVQGIE